MQTKAILLASCFIFSSLPVYAAEKVSGVNKDLQVLSDSPTHTGSIPIRWIWSTELFH
jgi:hypothetical protein